MRYLVVILLLLNLAAFSQVKVSTGNSGYFNVQINDGRILSYPKDVYEITEDERGGFYLQNVNGVKRIPISRNGLGVVYSSWTVNGTTPSSPQALIDSLEKYVYSDAENVTVNTQLTGLNDIGEPVSLSATAEGHLEIAVHSPELPFGSIHTEKLTPVFQADAVYGVNPTMNQSTTGLSFGTGTTSGTVTGTNNLFKVSTGTTQYSFATIQSRRRLRYRPGQGVVARFAGFFSQGVANSISVAGIGTAESGFYFGQRNDTLGILHVTGGVRELHTFTISTASTSTNSYRVYLPNGDSVTVAATNNASTTQTAYEISQGTFPGWSAAARGETVIFLAASVGNRTGSFTLAQPGAGSPAAGSDAETTAGVASTDTWYMQKDWNGDKLDGTGASGVTIDKTKGNVYQIGVQYLGFGNVTFEVEIDPQGNNPYFVTVHTLRFPNTLTSVHTSQPSFPFTMAAYSAGSTTDVSVSVGSYAGFVEGEIVNTGPRMSYFRTTAVTSSTSAYVPIFTVRNALTFNGRANQAVSNLLNVDGAAKSNTGLTTFYLIRNAALTGPVNFTQFSTSSTSYFDTGATGCTFSTNDQVIWSGTVSESGDFNYAFEDKNITLQPGESITLAVRSVTATATCIGGFNTREDQ